MRGFRGLPPRPFASYTFPVSHKLRNLAAAVLILASFCLLYPGVTRPALTLDVTPVLPFLGKMTLLHETRSILGTVRKLHETGNDLVAGLILFFSIAVPVIKGLLLLYVLSFRNGPGRLALFKLVGAIGKWSMADVFVMGLFLAYLAGNAVAGMTAMLHHGFWYFLGYCLLSVLSAQLMKVGPEKPGDLPAVRPAA